MGISYEFKRVYSILFKVFYDNVHIEPIISSLKSPFGKKSIQRITDISYGVARHNLFLEALIKKLSKRNFDKIEREILLIIKIALYQLILNPIRPDYAVVDEAVEFAKSLGKENSARFVNAILRKIQKKPQLKKDIFSLGPPEEKLSIKYSHPLFLVERWIKEFGLRKTEEILKENQEIPKFDLLVNIKKIDLKEMKDLLLKNKIIAEETPYCPAGLKILKGNIKELPEEIKKNIYVMDLTAQGFAHLFSQFKGNSFIDLASAPGGKSLCISLFHNYKIQIASDLFFTRLFKAKKNFQNFEREIKLLIQSILKPALKGDIFDRILLDAPCSGTGVLRKNPEAKWRIKEKDFSEYKKKQKGLLHTALDLLSKKGMLFYITCSLEREENEEVVLKTIEEKKGFEIFKDYDKIKHPILNFLEPSGFIRVFPQEELDGMTGVIIKRL